jgi:hypothetical protein
MDLYLENIPWLFGAVVVEPSLSKTFYGKVKPISEEWIPDALAVSGITREDHLLFDEPVKVMSDFREFLKENSRNRPVFVSDNPTFDWQWINYYFHFYLGSNPFGFSARRIGDMYAGMQKDLSKGTEWKKFRKTPHTHNPVDDAKGNAEAMLVMKDMGLKF